MLEDLKIGAAYEGFLFLAESIRNPPVLRPHRHVELELNLVVEGEVTYVTAGRSYRFPKRSLIWFFPSQVHQLIDRSTDAAYYVAVFKHDLIRRACTGPRYRALKRRKPESGGILHRDLGPVDFDALCSEMNAVVEDGLDPDLLNREAGFGLSSDFRFEHNDPDWLNAGLRHILLYAWRLQERSANQDRAVSLHPCVRDALEFLEEEGWEDSSLKAIANQCRVSPSFLSRRFREEIGVPLSRYRNSLRLGRFWEQRKKYPHATLIESVFAAGFGSYAQFFRVYTAAYGRGPRETLAGRGA